MQPCMIIIWISLVYIEASQTSWKEGNESLPRASDEMAVGEYNGTIFLIGGHGNSQGGDGKRRQLTQFDIDTQNVTDLGGTFFPVAISGPGQFWTQQAHIIYLIEETTPTLNIFNAITKAFTTDWQGITLPIHLITAQPYRPACLASSETFLYVLGGNNGSSIKSVQMLSLSTYLWTSNTPPMQVARYSHACLVHKNYLWVFGGESGDSDGTSTKHAVNERIQVTQITDNTWQFIDSFSVGLTAIRAVSWNDVIYIIGG
eukprot:729722_1